MKSKAVKGIVTLGLILLAGLWIAACKAPEPPAPPPPPPPPPPAPVITVSFPTVNIASIEIKAPVEKVFKYVADVNNAMKYFPGMKSISNVQGQGLGSSYSFTDEATGKLISGDGVCIDYVANQRIVLLVSDGAVWNSVFLPGAEGGTKLILTLQYSAEVPVLNDAVKKDVSKKYQDLVETILKNIKTELEASAAAPAPAPAPAPEKPKK